MCTNANLYVQGKKVYGSSRISGKYIYLFFSCLCMSTIPDVNITQLPNQRRIVKVTIEKGKHLLAPFTHPILSPNRLSNIDLTFLQIRLMRSYDNI